MDVFLIKFLLGHLSRRLTGELIAYIRRHPAPTRRPSVGILSNDFSVEAFLQIFPI